MRRDTSNTTNSIHLGFTHLCAAFALTSALTAGCKQTEKAPPPAPASVSAADRAQVSDTITATATVVSVNPETRLVELKGPDGARFTVQCGPEVRNFAQIAPGDLVRVKYLQSLAVALKKPGDASVPASAAIAAGRAPQGAAPAAGLAAQVTTTVKIESVDTQKNIVVFTNPASGMHAVKVQRPEGREFIRGLKPGDRVEITYTEALAVAVEKE